MMRRMIDRAGWALAGALALAVVVVAAREAQGGPLDPPAAPGSTLQSLAQMPPDWSQQLDATNNTSCTSTRFECVMIQFLCTPICHFAYQGVLNHETGLVWQRDPSANAVQSFNSAIDDCIGKSLGGRLGWRMPTASELGTLVDQSNVGPAASLPTGHPFQNIVNDIYWTATDAPQFTGYAYAINFVGASGFPAVFGPYGKVEGTARPWCVRGAVTQ